MRRPAPAFARLAVLAALLALTGMAAEMPPRQEIEGSRSTRDGVFSSGEAARGRSLYERVCSYCHDHSEFGPDYMVDWEGQPLGVLYDLVRLTMPEDNPGDLSRRQYADLVAYLLHLNGAPEGEQDMGHDAAELDLILIAGPFEERGDQR